MRDLIHSALLKKLQEKSLASLYLITYNSETTEPLHWVDQFQKELTPLSDHPDILRLFKGPKESEYKVDSAAINDLINFISTRPLQLEKKFIFLFDAQDLSVIVSNKLLKVFEELGSDYCLMLFAPRNAALLETVQSRAVKLTLSDFNIQESADSRNLEESFSKLKTPQDLIAFLRENEGNLDLEKKFIEHAVKQCLAHATSSMDSYKQIDELLSTLKDFETRLAFNNSKLSRLTPFFP